LPRRLGGLSSQPAKDKGNEKKRNGNQPHFHVALIASGMLPDEIAHMLLLSPERTDEIIHPLCVELGVSNQVDLLLLIYSLQELPALPEELAPERGSESPIG